MNKTFIESIKSIDGEIFNITFHQKRYENVLHSLDSTNYQNLLTHLKAPQKGVYRCRVLYTQNELSVSYHAYTKREVKSLKLVYDDKIEYSKKYANREKIEKLFLLKESADDILIIQNSLVKDTSIANIAFFDNNRWITPKQPLLKGTTRARLLEQKRLFEEDIYEKDLKKYTKIALLNAMIDFDIIHTENVRNIYC